MTGLDGTPMPSYGDSLDPEEGWDLALYIFSLSPIKGKPMNFLFTLVVALLLSLSTWGLPRHVSAYQEDPKVKGVSVKGQVTFKGESTEDSRPDGE